MAALAAEGVAFARVNPRQVRDFAKGIGRLAKTDPIDARVLAMFGERARPRLTTLPTAQEAHLKALSLRRRQLIDARVAEKNHRTQVTSKDIMASITRMIDALDDEIEGIEDEIAVLIASCEKMRGRQELLERHSVVAATTRAVVLAELPKPGDRWTSVLKALVEIAPYGAIPAASKGSGTFKAAGPLFPSPLHVGTNGLSVQSDPESLFNALARKANRTNRRSSPASPNWSRS